MPPAAATTTTTTAMPPMGSSVGEATTTTIPPSVLPQPTAAPLNVTVAGAVGQPHRLTSFWRVLSEEYLKDNTAEASTITTTESWDPKVFWAVNGSILLLLTVTCGTCYQLTAAPLNVTVAGAAGQPHRLTSFWRALSEEYSKDNAAEASTTTTAESWDSKVFWVVNGFILLLLTITCGTCYIYGGLPWWRINQAETRQNSDAAYRARLARRLEEEKERRRGTPEKRKKALLRSFKRCKVCMVVQVTDLVDCNGDLLTPVQVSSGECNDSNNSDSMERGEASPKVVAEMMGETTETVHLKGLPDEDDDCSESTDDDKDDKYDPEGLKDVDLEADKKSMPVLPSYDEDENASNGYLILREPSSELPPVCRRVPNCCAICLGCYEVGQHAVWSSNKKCAHAFHMECLVDWLTKMRDGTPCPCCRAEFTDLEKHRRKRKITWQADHAFNPSVIAFS